MSMYGRGGGFGGGRGLSLRIGPGLPMPPVVKTLLIVNVGIYVLSVLPGMNAEAMSRFFGLVPRDVFGHLRFWQLFTYMFIHSGLLHVGLNMFLLWMFGTTVEHSWGSQDFLSYYVICGVGGALAQWISGPGSPVVTIGASAAVLGVLVAYAMMYPDRMVLLYFVIPLKIKYLMWFVVAVDLIGALAVRSDNIAHFAHLGGMLSGWLYLKQDWRLTALTRRVRGIRARYQMQQNARRQGNWREERKHVDEILDKISEQGIDSLTEEERRILREASRH